jgi:hypothetical protein
MVPRDDAQADEQGSKRNDASTRQVKSISHFKSITSNQIKLYTVYDSKYAHAFHGTQLVLVLLLDANWFKLYEKIKKIICSTITKKLSLSSNINEKKEEM